VPCTGSLRGLEKLDLESRNPREAALIANCHGETVRDRGRPDHQVVRADHRSLSPKLAATKRRLTALWLVPRTATVDGTASSDRPSLRVLTPATLCSRARASSGSPFENLFHDDACLDVM
jgi:hypothetical protein